MIRVLLAHDQDHAGSTAADLITAALSSREHPVLGVATGSTPLTTWDALASSGQDFAHVSAFALDEYLGLTPGHPESYAEVVRREVTEKLGLDRRNVHVPGDEGMDAGAGPRFESAIARAGGIDVQVLGIGRNGHIGFNEPGSSFTSRTRVVDLAPQTRLDNARFFPSLEDVPTQALTQGIGTLRDARRLVLIAFGAGKAPAVAAAVCGEVATALPASAIQLHDDVTVIVDEAAATMLPRDLLSTPAPSVFAPSGL